MNEGRSEDDSQELVAARFTQQSFSLLGRLTHLPSASFLLGNGLRWSPSFILSEISRSVLEENDCQS